jgi:hypothetical protein
MKLTSDQFRGGGSLGGDKRNGADHGDHEGSAYDGSAESLREKNRSIILARAFASAPPIVDKIKRWSAPLRANRCPSHPHHTSSEASHLLLALRVLAIDVEHVRRSLGRVQHTCDGVDFDVDSRLRTYRRRYTLWHGPLHHIHLVVRP